MAGLDFNNLPQLDLSSLNFDTSRILAESTFAELEQSRRALESCRPKPIGEIIEDQLKPVLDQNQETIRVLKENYDQLQKLNIAKDQEIQEAQNEAKKSKRYNIIMLIIAILSMLSAMASWIVPLLLEIL